MELQPHPLSVWSHNTINHIIQVRLGSLSVCLIDDCVNRDVPLLDFSLVDFQAEHHLMTAKQGRARGVFAGDYYNRNISAWEPVVEQWR